MKKLSVAPTNVDCMKPLQPSFDDLGVPLFDVSFCVVDLETTGVGEGAAITEIGAVKVRGGEAEGEFATLVNPQMHIPANITVLTGISDRMVDDAPTINTVLPSFLEFARGTVLVAHNASFDVGFLKRACANLGYEWPGNQVVDTVKLARHTLLRDEVRNCKLSTLSAFFKVPEMPTHRALDDARATVYVLHGLLERVGALGVTTLEDLLEYAHHVSPQRRAKRVWTKDLPEEPGIYQFYTDKSHKDGSREILYVGKSVNIKKRVATYFTASETRGRMEEMVRISTGVEAIVCQTPLEAEIRELRTIDSQQPHYNRRSRRQHKLAWLKLTNERWPRFSVVSKITDDAKYFGPCVSRRVAQELALVLSQSFKLRQCTQRIGPRSISSSCALAQLNRCFAPCRGDDETLGELYSLALDEAIRSTYDVRAITESLSEQMRTLSAQERFEEAGVVRDRLGLYQRTILRWQRLKALTRCPLIVAASPNAGGWQINIVKYGFLAGAARAKRGESALAIADEALRVSATVPKPQHGLPAGSVEEAECIANWLESPGVRLMQIEGDWAIPSNAGAPQMVKLDD